MSWTCLGILPPAMSSHHPPSPPILTLGTGVSTHTHIGFQGTLLVWGVCAGAQHATFLAPQ